MPGSLRHSRSLKVISFSVGLLLASLPLIGYLNFGHSFCNTSSNAVLYFVKTESGLISVTQDLAIEDAGSLLFEVDMNCLFSWIKRGEAAALGKTILDVTWDDESGRGNVKQFRPDGTRFLVTFARFNDGGRTGRGLFIGGDLSYGDFERSGGGETSGISYYDGKKWYHIWCAANEGMALVRNPSRVYAPDEWTYLSGRVVMQNEDGVILESRHSLEAEGKKIFMTRVASVQAGNDFVTMTVEFVNGSGSPVEINYEYGDEPWLGAYHDSSGDVGWTEEGLVRYEQAVSLKKTRFAGFWDYGNDAADESHTFSGYANFIRWLSPPPSFVYFSNDFSTCCNGNRPLSSEKNRVINVAWTNQVIYPGESSTYKFIVGKAPIDKETGFPTAP